jgi:hypothetical protein
MSHCEFPHGRLASLVRYNGFVASGGPLRRTTTLLARTSANIGRPVYIGIGRHPYWGRYLFWSAAPRGRTQPSPLSGAHVSPETHLGFAHKLRMRYGARTPWCRETNYWPGTPRVGALWRSGAGMAEQPPPPAAVLGNRPRPGQPARGCTSPGTSTPCAATRRRKLSVGPGCRIRTPCAGQAVLSLPWMLLCP